MTELNKNSGLSLVIQLKSERDRTPDPGTSFYLRKDLRNEETLFLPYCYSFCCVSNIVPFVQFFIIILVLVRLRVNPRLFLKD